MAGNSTDLTAESLLKYLFDEYPTDDVISTQISDKHNIDSLADMLFTCMQVDYLYAKIELVYWVTCIQFVCQVNR